MNHQQTGNMSTQTPATPITTDQIAIWNDDTASITNVRLRTDVPKITPPDLKLQLIKGGHTALLFLALQVERTRDKEVALRALASAVGILFRSEQDYTGGTSKPVFLSSLNDAETDFTTLDDGEVVGGNFIGGEKITAGEIRVYLGDVDEIGAWYGVMFMAGVKKRTNKNRDAFNKNRIPNVKSTVNEELLIFTPNSALLSDEVLDTVYASFNAYLPNRMYLVQQAVRLSAGTSVGPALAFTNMFVLLEDAGLGSLRVIKEAVLKYTWIRSKFPELQSELNAASVGQKAVRRIDLADRPFCKAIYGNRFVPIGQNDIANLLGVCKRVMSFTVLTYKHFDGGNVSDKQEAIIRQMLEESGVTLTPEASE